MILLLAQAVFVGNQACAVCHPEISRTYAATAMARSSGPVAGDVPPGSFHHAPSGVTYRIGDTGLVRIEGGRLRAERRLDYFIGSGAAGRSYLWQSDGFLFQAPVTWYAQKSLWDMSPGFESDRSSRWSRAIEPSCLYCHASQAQPVRGTQNAYGDPPFLQNGVACERCHGPGSEHVHGRAKMIRPGRLDPARRDAVCAQCHLTGEARIERAGRRLTDYRPGELLSDYAAFFVYEDRSAALKATSHVEKLYASRCKQASGERLWCGSCHDPHSTPAAADRASWYRAKCLSCHESGACRRGPDCASCHMPKGRVVDGGHGVLTDHSIPRLAKSLAFERSSPWKLTGFSRADRGDREFGLAYAEVFLRTGDRRQMAEAVRLLERATPDAQTQVRLADLYQRRGEPDRAEPLYRAVLDRDRDNVVALVNLGGLLGARGQLGHAIALWRRALEKNPCLEEAAQNLAAALRAEGKFAEAAIVRTGRSFCEP